MPGRVARSLALVAAPALGVLLLAACGPAASPAPAAPAAKPAGGAPAAGPAQGSAPAAKPAGGGQATRVRFGYIPIIDAATYYVADKKGYFNEEGLDVEGSKLAGGAAISQAIEGGSLDMGLAGGLPASQAYLQGFDFRYFRPLNFEERPNNLGTGLLVGVNSDIRSPRDLEGKNIAVNALGATPEFTARLMMAQVGADYTKAKFVAVPFPQMEAALQQGRVDALAIVEPFYFQAVDHGVGRVLEQGLLGQDMKSGEPVMYSGVLAKKPWIEANLDTVRRFARALDKAVPYAQQNEKELRQIIAEYTGVEPAVAEKIILPALSQRIRKENIQPVVDGAARVGMLDRAFDANELIFPVE